MNYFFSEIFNKQYIKQSYSLSQKYNRGVLFASKNVLQNSVKDLLSLNKNIDVFIKTSAKNIVSVLYYFNKCSLSQYKQLIDIVCYDKPENSWRFTIQYLLYSVTYNSNFYISIKASELVSVPTATSIFLSATWLEREVWDLFGVFFEKNPKLSRILTDYGFTGHPLRKDFPLSGFNEVSYSYSEHRIISSKVELSQESRFYIS